MAKIVPRGKSVKPKVRLEVHVIPVGNEEPIHHAAQDCWCYPLAEDYPHVFGHNAKDCREKFERQNVFRDDTQWVQVYGQPYVQPKVPS